MNMARFNALARKAVATSHRSRIRANVALTAATVNETSLLLVDDEPNYDLTSDGTNIAEAEARSRVRKIDLTVSFFAGTSNAAGALVEWLLFRDPDNFANVTAPSDLFTADLNTVTMSLRKNALAYGGFFSSANNDTRVFHIRISRKAMQRTQVLQDNDRIKLQMVTAATGAKYFIHGAITTMK